MAIYGFVAVIRSIQDCIVKESSGVWAAFIKIT